jgi:hypothetical protein
MNIFEITIQHKYKGRWPVVVEQSQSGSLPTRSEGFLNLDEEKQTRLITLEQSHQEYGTLLGQALFHEMVRDGFMQARSGSEGNLRVLLVIESSELKTLHWERLCAPIRTGGAWDFLALDQQILFSLYLPSLTDRRFPAIGWCVN